MNATTLQLMYTVEDGLLFSLVTVGVYVSFRVLRFPDLTAEGGFGLAVTAGGLAILATGSFTIGLVVSTLAGAATGVASSLLANWTRLPTILSSILVMTMCVSAGLLLAGRPNFTLPTGWWIADWMPADLSPVGTGIAGGAILLVVIGAALVLLFNTGAGLLLRTRGENPRLLRELGRSLTVWDAVGLGIANGIIGFAAALLSQQAGYTTIHMGRGVVIGALAAILLGESLFPHRSFAQALVGCVVGTLVLRLVRLLGLNLGLPDGALDLVTSAIVIVFYVAARGRLESKIELLDNIRL